MSDLDLKDVFSKPPQYDPVVVKPTHTGEDVSDV